MYRPIQGNQKESKEDNFEQQAEEGLTQIG